MESRESHKTTSQKSDPNIGHKPLWDEHGTTTRSSGITRGQSSLLVSNRARGASQEKTTDRSGRTNPQKSAISHGKKKRVNFYDVLISNVLLLFVLLSIITGFITGALLRQRGKWSQRDITLIRFPGELLLRVLHCLSIPVAMSSVAGAVGRWQPRKTATIGTRAFLYAVVSTTCAILTGMFLVLVIQPGSRSSRLPADDMLEGGTRLKVRQMGVTDILDMVRNLVPANVVEEFVFMTQTNWKVTNGTNRDSMSASKLLGANLLGLVTFSVFLGFAIAHSGAGSSNILLRFVLVLSSKFMRMADIVLWYSPVGICSLIAADVLRIENPPAMVSYLGKYVFTVLLGLGVHSFLFLPAVYMIYVRKNTGNFFLNILHPLAIAFGTSSSVAASPVAISILETRVGLSPTVVRFVLPLGALLNRDGTALYEMVAVLFVAQVRGAQPGVGSLVILCLAAVFLSFGIYGLHPAYRGASHATFLLYIAGLDGDDVGFMLASHWLLKRFGNAVNLLSDSVAVAVLQNIDEREATQDILDDADRMTPETHHLNTSPAAPATKGSTLATLGVGTTTASTPGETQVVTPQPGIP